MQRGIILSQNGDVDALTENYEIAISIEPKDIFTRNDYALRLIEMGYTEKAYQLYADWLQKKENAEDSCYAGMGYILMLNGEWEKSIEMLEKANSYDKPDILTHLYMSFFYFFTINFDKAYEYEAIYRLQFEPSGEVYRKTSIAEFIEGYKKNWQFQKLVQNIMTNE
jgi:tetratricopeptide (TPR) repeat protein